MREPLFSQTVHVGRPNVPDRERLMARIEEILDRRWFSNAGPMVGEFEARIAEYIGVKHCIAVCNGTIALEIAIRGLDLKGEVIVPSFTFVATAHALQWQEITPVFCDIDPWTHSIDPNRVEQLITPRTTGILGVHLWGRPCNVEALSEIANRRGLKLLYDASHALGCSHGGTMVGNFGSAEVFSFHATKFLSTFEGGAITTNDDALAARLRLMKNFGFAGYDNVVHLGTNGKMNEICAAMGLTMLEEVDQICEHNRVRLNHYRKLLTGTPGVRVLTPAQDERSNYQYAVLEVDETRAGIHRDDVLKALHAENILARKYFYPGCHRMEPYRSFYPHASLLLPQTEALCQRVLVLPTGPTLSLDEIASIASVVKSSVAASQPYQLQKAA